MPLDISAEHLHAAAQRLREERPELEITPVVADYSERMPELGELARAPEGGRAVVFFSGSSIGNFEPEHAARFLDGMARMAGPRGLVLVAVDLRKDRSVLEPAYDDAARVTEAFDKNVLVRVNRELGADFDLGAWRHRAPFQERESRIEMQLVSTRPQVVHVGEHTLRFGEGDVIVTEHCYKYTLASFGELAGRAGLVTLRTWLDGQDRYSLHLLAREREP